MALLAAAAWEVARVSRADLLRRRGDLQGAIAADPGNADYLAAGGRLAEALRLRPADADLWIALGLEREAARDYADAERFLLRAAGASRKYAPRWTLANFYFRRGREDEFWRWVRAAFEISYGDRTPLFDLCWAMSGDGDLILRRAIPANEDLWRLYLAYLSGRQRWGAAAKLAAAFERRHLSLDGTLFSWRPANPPGVTTVRQGEGWRFSLDGTQPEHCEFLSMFVPPPASGKLRLSASYRSSLSTPEDAVTGTGLRWRVFPLGGGGGTASDPLASSSEQTVETVFEVSPDAPAARIALVYDKQPGTMRLEGTLTVSAIEVSPVP